MRSRDDIGFKLTSQAALAIDRELGAPAPPGPETLWQRYLGFLRSEGFDSRQMAIATRRDDEERMETERRLFGFLASGVAAAAALLALTLVFGGRSEAQSPAPDGVHDARPRVVLMSSAEVVTAEPGIPRP